MKLEHNVLGSQLKILMILDETTFFQPEFVDELLGKIKGQFAIEVLLIKKPPKAGNLKANLLSNFRHLKVDEIARLGFQYLKSNCFPKISSTGQLYIMRSVSAVLKNAKIPYKEIASKKQLEEQFRNIEYGHYDILFSSNSMILKKNWLLKFRIGALNRHSSLLPSFGGLWPVFHSAKMGINEYGASIHVMTERIDDGPVLAQAVFHAKQNESIFFRYETTFRASAGLAEEALIRLIDGNLESISNYPASYFGLLKSEDFEMLRTQKVKFA